MPRKRRADGKFIATTRPLSTAQKEAKASQKRVMKAYKLIQKANDKKRNISALVDF